MIKEGPEVEEIADNEWLSQYGSILAVIDGEPFKGEPGRNQEDLSLIRGRVSPDQAAESVSRRRKEAAPGEGVRYVRAGNLRDAGFTVMHTPTSRNKNHVSVTAEGTSGIWAAEHKLRYRECFNNAEQVWKEGHLANVES